jgi:hypothetical protein
MNNSVIFVTAFKNLNRHSWKGFERSIDNYINYFENLSMIPIRLICYCEDNVRDILHKKLNFFNTYPYKSEETFYRFYDKEKSIMESLQFKNLIKHRDDPETNKPGYNLVNHNKIWFIKRTKNMFPNYTHYAWIDFGCIRSKDKIPQQLDFKLLSINKITYACDKCINIQDLLTPVEACKNINNQNLMGSEFFCPKDMVDWYYDEYYKMVMRYYANNLVDDDQEIVKQILRYHSDKFNLVATGEWFNLLNTFKVKIAIDVVIPTCLKDIDTLHLVIQGVKKNVENVRNIYIVCNRKYKHKIRGGIFIDEEAYPFSINDISSINLSTKLDGRKAGWWFQQLLKIYSFKIIKHISSNILIVDSETIFYNKYTPIKDNKANYAVSNEINDEYRDHMKYLLGDINIFNSKISGICHQMLFQTHILQNLIDRVEKYHIDMREIYMPFWKIMLLLSERYKIYYSEYDIYFNFMLTFHKNTVNITNSISWDISSIIPRSTNYTYITCHSHLRGARYLPSNSFYINLKSVGIHESNKLHDSNKEKDYNQQLLYMQDLKNKNMYKQNIGINRSFKMQNITIQNVNVNRSFTMQKK